MALIGISKVFVRFPSVYVYEKLNLVTLSILNKKASVITFENS